MVEMELNKIIIDEKRQEQIIVLKEKKGERILPIVIGFVEATSIKMSLSGILPPRPLTHDLLCCVIEALGAGLKKIWIDKLEDGTFHAKLALLPLKAEVAEIVVDARPSDSIALAVRFKAPVFVAEEVLKKADLFHPGA
jgi:bifunctional DNase/RNase